MFETAVAAAPAVALIGKKELAQRLGWSRPRLDRRLEQDPRFPVVTRGNQQGGWDFDLEEVLAYLGEAATDDDEPEAEAAAEPDAPQRTSIAHRGEETATQRLKAAQAQLAEDRIARQRGELVEAAPLKAKLETAVAKLAASLNALPDTLGRRLNLPEAAVGVVRQEIEDSRRGFFNELRNLLTDA